MFYTDVNISDAEIPNTVFLDTEVRAGRLEYGGLLVLPRPILPVAGRKEATLVMTPFDPFQSSPRPTVQGLPPVVGAPAAFPQSSSVDPRGNGLVAAVVLKNIFP